MVITMQIAGDDKTNFGKSMKIAPMTMDSIKIENKCFLVNGTNDQPVEPQAVLPDISKFTVCIYLYLFVIFFL